MSDISAHEDIINVLVQLGQMSMTDCQKFMNYLSSRLRMIGYIMHRHSWKDDEGNLFSWFQAQALQELVC